MKWYIAYAAYTIPFYYQIYKIICIEPALLYICNIKLKLAELSLYQLASNDINKSKHISPEMANFGQINQF